MEVARVVDRALRPVRWWTARWTRSPFPEGASHLIVHATHHKAGTMWFHALFDQLALRYGMRLEVVEDTPPLPGTDLYLNHHSRFDPDALPPHRGSHMVRDPRDMVVSAYRYHLWTDEAWAHRPRPELDGQSYQQRLRSLDEHDGLLLEIERCARDDFLDMQRWDYERPEYLELRYEDVRTDGATWFRRLFEHYGFSPEGIEEGLAAADHVSFESLKRREQSRRGGRPKHLRSGRAGQWQDELGPAHRDRLKEVAGDLIVGLGYETDDTW